MKNLLCSLAAVCAAVTFGETAETLFVADGDTVAKGEWRVGMDKEVARIWQDGGSFAMNENKRLFLGSDGVSYIRVNGGTFKLGTSNATTEWRVGFWGGSQFHVRGGTVTEWTTKSLDQQGFVLRGTSAEANLYVEDCLRRRIVRTGLIDAVMVQSAGDDLSM